MQGIWTGDMSRQQKKESAKQYLLHAMRKDLQKQSKLIENLVDQDDKSTETKKFKNDRNKELKRKKEKNYTSTSNGNNTGRNK